MGLLEDELRSTFAAHVTAPPTVDDPAGRAIRSAGRTRRRRATFGTAAVVVTVALGGVGIGMLKSPWSGSGIDDIALPALTSPTAAHAPVDVLAGGTIVTADGRVISLPNQTTILSAARVPDGWLVETDETGLATLWYIDPAGQAKAVVNGDFLTISGDGSKLAWRKGGTVSVGDRVGSTVTPTAQTTGTGLLGPIAFAGGGVVLGASTKGLGYDTFEMWYPAKGAYKSGPSSTDKILTPTADGSELWGLAGADASCLALIKPQSLTAVQTNCELDVAGVHKIFPSPDGRWLLAVGTERVDLYDLATVWTAKGPNWSWPVAGQNVAAWMEGDTFVLGGEFKLVQIDVGETKPTDIPVAGTAERFLTPIPSLGG